MKRAPSWHAVNLRSILPGEVFRFIFNYYGFLVVFLNYYYYYLVFLCGFFGCVCGVVLFLCCWVFGWVFFQLIKKILKIINTNISDVGITFNNTKNMLSASLIKKKVYKNFLIFFPRFSTNITQ